MEEWGWGGVKVRWVRECFEIALSLGAGFGG
jgi:hypothetical protein